MNDAMTRSLGKAGGKTLVAQDLCARNQICAVGCMCHVTFSLSIVRWPLPFEQISGVL